MSTAGSSDLQLVAALKGASRVCAGAVVALGLLVLVGWAYDVDALKRIHRPLASMKPNTAVSFVLLGVAAWLAPRPGRSLPRRATGLLVTALAVATCLEHAFGLDLGIDQVLFTERAVGAGHAPGRMAPITSCNLLLLGLAVLALDDARRFRRMQLPVVLAGLTSFVALLGYLYDAPSLYAVGPFESIALHTTIGLLVVCFALLAARCEQGALGITTSRTSAGAFLRRLLPAIPATLVVLGWFALEGQAAGLYGTSFGVGMLIASSTVILTGVALLVATSLYRLELEQQGVREGLSAADRAMRRSEALKAAVLDSAFDAIVWMDDGGLLVEFNRAAERLFGYRRDQVIGRAMVELLVPPSLRDAHQRGLARHLSSGEERLLGRVVELRAMRADRSEFIAEIAITRVRDQEAPLFAAFVRDAGERKQVERSRERDRFFQLSIDMVCIANTSGYFLQLSPAFEQVLGYRADEMLALPFLDFVHPDDHPATLREVEKLAAGHLTIDFTNRYRRSDGSYRWFQWRAAPGADGLLYAIARDITDDIHAADALRARVKEREVLLREVHHRVKNNLQVISSLINMQARQLRGDGERAALAECQSRVQAIALIHEKLYQSEDYARVPFSDYARSLSADVFHAIGVSSALISLRTEMDDLPLAVDRAIPCGLILNELVTNALKHAFPDQRGGTVCVALRRSDQGEAVLSVSDDGVGLRAGFEVARSGTLGMELVATLVEQLDGRLEIVSRGGTTFRVTFPLDGSP